MDRTDNLTFKANFTGDGVIKLRDRVNDKLKEFMGDYTDDTLVEYVIVLLRNGRRKDEAKNELNVFLGDDSDSFVSWLWDHLASNLNLYVEPQELQDEAPKRKPISVVQAGDDDSHNLDSDSARGKSNKLLRSRHNKEWKGLVREAAEPPPLRSSELNAIHVEEKSLHEVNRGLRSLSPQRPFQRKRNRPDERQSTKKDTVSQGTIDAPRRLLQFAVRDAVATLRPSNLAPPVEPKLKRLRSVVSTSTGESSFVDRPQRIQSVARVPNPMATVIKAVAEAAEDVTKVKSSGNVFDRLGRATNSSHIEDNNQIKEQRRPLFPPRSGYTGEYVADMTMLESEAGFPSSDSTSDNEGYDNVNVMGRGMAVPSQIGTSGGNKGEDTLTQYSVAKNGDNSMHLNRNRVQDQSAAAPNASRKIVNISVNVNTWKPPHYQEPREVTEEDSHRSIEDGDMGASRYGAQAIKEISNPMKVSNGKAKPAAEMQESQKTQASTPSLYAAARPLEDADSRTIFVSNVHFAATKDSLSRHFNKFGEVLKVIIVTDAATGQPTGSAYVEFMRKEAADNALSLDGTSFMSRILKVVRRTAAQQESAPVMTWPRISRGSPFTPARFSRAPFPRGIPGAFRPRPAIIPGARSMQWKRDAQATPADGGASFSANSVPASAARSLTYVRTESKPAGSQGTT
ncbi:putative RNA binding family protein [Quillaja saponaria]|uniref:RNA binding family protein n=1 Tax=Quillaja saponaria TaxID=32244 RepID=A0AAD7L0F3_QUISA|nr:putative RNA binding family protein [Quillaja saponaria]